MGLAEVAARRRRASARSDRPARPRRAARRRRPTRSPEDARAARRRRPPPRRSRPRTRARPDGAVAVLVGALGEVLDVALERTGGRVGHEPFAARDDRRHAVAGREVRMRRLLRPVLAQALDGGQHDRHLLDRVDGAALLGRKRRDAGVPRAAAHRDARQQAAAAGDPHGQAARLGHDGGVGLQQARGEQPARAGRLLLGDRVDDQVAGQRNAELGQRARRHDHARHAALHVARPAAVEPAVAHVGGEGVRQRPVASAARRRRRRRAR